MYTNQYLRLQVYIVVNFYNVVLYAASIIVYKKKKILKTVKTITGILWNVCNI